ncbi:MULTISPECIES: hypothetical protein [Olivibacter]|uniref:Tetratricopeptide repeat protein n=1 Tax=Olivibacter jilunii TaxID=985016 RepID=A0ABW6B7V5_9SPHI|nr:hypothetical protein [Pseudosphingobacterium sp.]
MAGIAQLSTLIRSLSKSEKRYFKWSYTRGNNDKVYHYLYRVIEKGVRDPAYIKNRLEKNFPDAKLEPACKHLYKMLMRSLRSFEADKSTENRLSNLLGDIKILFDKGLYELCFSELDKAKKLALKHEKFAFYILLAKQELLYLTNLEFPGIDENALIQKQEKIVDLLYHELYISRHASLYELLMFRYQKNGNVRSELETTKLNDLLLEEFQVNAMNKYTSFESEKLHLHFQSIYFLMTGSPKQSLQIFEELNVLFQKNKQLWGDSPVHYIYMLHGVLTNLYLTTRNKEMPYFLHELEKVVTDSESVLLLRDHMVYFHRLGFLQATENFSEANELAKQYENRFLSKNLVVAPNASAEMSFRLSVLYFCLGKFQQSLQLVNSVLNSAGLFISLQLYILGRLLHLLIHLELENDDYLYYEIKSVERKLKKGKKLFTLEKITLRMLKKWLTLENKEELLYDYRNALLDLEKNDYENQLLRQFPFQHWIASRLQKKLICELVY